MPRRGLKSTLGYFLSAGYGDGHNNGIAHFGMPNVSRYILTLSSIILRGVGLMAGAPNSNPNPGMVTMPIPSPPAMMILKSFAMFHRCFIYIDRKNDIRLYPHSIGNVGVISGVFYDAGFRLHYPIVVYGTGTGISLLRLYRNIYQFSVG